METENSSSSYDETTWTDVFETYHGTQPPKPHMEFVENLIDLLLADPRFNILVLPDAIEKQIYRSVIYMLLETLMSAVWNLNGVKFLHHEIELELIYDNMPIFINNLETIDIGAIESLIDDLLKDTSINISWLPDSIEKTLYTTILFLIFTVLEVIASSVEITLIGHALKLSFGPNGDGFQKLHEKFKSTLRNAQSLSKLRSHAWRYSTTASKKETPTERTKLIEEMVDKAMKNSSGINSGKEAVNSNGKNKSGQDDRSQQQGSFSYMPLLAERTLYITIYTMILCVIEELLDSMSIRLLGDLVLLKLVPASGNNDIDDDARSDNKIVATQEIRKDDAVVKNVRIGYSEWHLLTAVFVGFGLNLVCITYFLDAIVFYYCP